MFIDSLRMYTLHEFLFGMAWLIAPRLYSAQMCGAKPTEVLPPPPGRGDFWRSLIFFLSPNLTAPGKQNTV